MARPKKSTKEVEKVDPYLEGVAKNLVERLYGPNGPAWGTKLTELEDVVVAVREALSEKMLAQALARQAAATEEQRPPDYRHCPKCGKSVTVKPKASGTEPGDDAGPPPRRVLTRAGQAQWVEPEAYCQQCRRSFFPSEQELGD
jgi:hypothetical protein